MLQVNGESGTASVLVATIVGEGFELVLGNARDQENVFQERVSNIKTVKTRIVVIRS